ncbi:Hypothetical protein R9X50_00681500 [Acrodontium crateriforme]|uniref:Uncharacterized protein n=1 Tax=Acrodontium crateriforme TaxID=150365 RepID=A0AAQ3MDJ3_9PEZI|nr:Hypothetical protein R9X50_00681500 [Acrodontium crateriforme]
MAAPLLVKAYDSLPSSNKSVRVYSARIDVPDGLPSVSDYAFTNILRSGNSKDVEEALEGMAAIYAKCHLSLANEYTAHIPPLGEITAETSNSVPPHLARRRPGPPWREMTTVPETTSDSSDGGHGIRKTEKKKGIFNFGRSKSEPIVRPMEHMRIGSMGRIIPVGSTTAEAVEWDGLWDLQPHPPRDQEAPGAQQGEQQQQPPRPSQAVPSLERILASHPMPEST